MAQGDGKKRKAELGGRPQWDPTDAEKELFDAMTPAELFKVSTHGGRDLAKLRRWYLNKNGGDVYDFYRALQSWQVGQ